MSEHEKRKNARSVLTRAGYKAGGHLSKHPAKATKHEIVEAVHEHEEHMHKGKKPTHLKLKHGGVAEGMGASMRGDRKPRGGKKPHTVVNVVVGRSHPQPMPVPVPRPAPAPMGPGGPPTMAGPMGPGAGPMPGMKRGGHVKRAMGGPAPMMAGNPAMMRPGVGGPVMARPPLKKGGKAGYPLKAGSGSGEGRLEKSESEAKRAGGKR